MTDDTHLPASHKPVDAHVHLVGDGSGGSGCWLRLRGWHRLFGRLMLRHLGLPSTAMTRDLDRLYVERLIQFVRGSSLGGVVLLAQDQVYDDDGKVIDGAGSYHVPNDYVLRLAREHPEFLPGVSIHPARPDALDELERCLAGGAVMMKLLPNCQNVDCSDRRFRRFWERMAEAGLPLLAHTGGEHTLPVIEPEYADPRKLVMVLECGVNVIAAHCATNSGLFDTDFFSSFADLTRRFTNLYGDTSAFTIPIRSKHVPQCRQPPLVERIVHGSDFPIPVYGHFAWMQRQIDWRTFRRWEKCPNPLERDYQLKRALGFPDEVFTRITRLLRLRISSSSECGQSCPPV